MSHKEMLLDWDMTRISIFKVSVVVVLAFVLLSPAIADEGRDDASRRDRMREVFKKVKSSILIVEGDTGVGSGFVVAMGKKKYMMTNRHVVEGKKEIRARFLNGKSIGLSTFEYAGGNKDLVRFEVSGDVPALQLAQGEPLIGDDAFVFGNSDGEGVATEIAGEVLAVGPEKLEVSNKFVCGNSGSAVLNAAGDVIGVSTYVTKDPNPADWTKQDTRFTDVRRWALRIGGEKWIMIRYPNFVDKSRRKERERDLEAGFGAQVQAHFSNPNMMVVPSRYAGGDGGFGLKSDIVLSMRAYDNSVAIKNPVIRVAVLLRARTGEYLVRGCIFDKAGSIRYARRCPPIYLHGDKQDGHSYDVGNGYVVYWLEGLSFYQKEFSGKSRMGIKYFDKTSDGDHYLFGVGNSECGAKAPEIVCYRLECWQNGALAGSYVSRVPQNIPLDWHCRGRYPMRFNYSNY